MVITDSKIQLIDDFKNKPEKYEFKEALKIPDGSPIGSYNCPI